MRATAPKKEPKDAPAPEKARAPAPKPRKAAAVAPAPAVGGTSPKAPAEPRDIGIDVPAPARPCEDPQCPFHGKLSVRGQALEGVVVSTRMQRTVVVERKYLHHSPKFERFEKRTRRMLAHAPPCLGLGAGHKVTMMECRPLSKTVSFVVIRNRGVGG